MDLINMPNNLDIAEINFPTHDNDGAKLMAPLLIQRELCERFGGCTAYDGHGSWVNANGKLYSEPVKIIKVAFKASQRNINILKHICFKHGKRAKQEAVYYSINNKATILDTRF